MHWITTASPEYAILMGRVIPDQENPLANFKDISRLFQEVITKTKGIAYLRLCGKETYEFFSDNCLDILENTRLPNNLKLFRDQNPGKNKLRTLIIKGIMRPIAKR